MTKRGLLSDASVRSRQKAPGYYLDGHGLYLQVSEGGSRSWILRYTLDKKRREMGLGSFDDFGLAQARERAQRERQLVADGIDPIEKKNARRKARNAEAAQRKTFKECALEYHEAHSDEWKNVKHAAQWINTLRDYAFPIFGNRPLGEVGKADIVKAIQPIWKTKAETAGRVLQRVRTVLNYAAAKDYAKGFDAEFWEQTRMSLGPNDKARKVEHHSSCPYQLVGSLAKAVRASTSTEIVKLAFEFTILTAARSGETRGALWSEIDKEARSWIIPAERMKAGRAHKVPLSEQAFALVETADALRKAGMLHSETGLIFPSASGLPFSDMVFAQILRRAGMPYTMHGFRASFRVWASEATEYPHEMLELALAHTVGDETVRAYMRTSMVEKRRQLMEDWAKYLRATENAALPAPTERASTPKKTTKKAPKPVKKRVI